MLTKLLLLGVVALGGILPLAQGQTSVPATQPVATTAPALDPFWPIYVKLPEELGGAPAPLPGKPFSVDLKVWIPEGAKRLRAVMLIPENTDSKHVAEHAPMRAAATKHEMGMIYMRNFKTGVEHWTDTTTPPDGKNILAMLVIVAKETGIKEFQYAPWVTFGKSSRGEFPFHTAWIFPKRVIASLTYHGETPTWPVPDWVKLDGETIMSVNANGEVEWGGTWFNHVRPSLLNYRSQKSWLSHQTVAKGVGHGDYVDGHGSEGWGKKFPGKVSTLQVWDYLAKFTDKALELRLPKDVYPTTGPITLNQVDETKGMVADPYAVEETFMVPHLPLREKDGLYVVGGGEEFPVTGFAKFAPLKDFAPGAGAPVVKLEPGKSPSEWLMTDVLKNTMQLDPMLDLGDYAKLMPKVGDTTKIDDTTVTFKPLPAKQVGPNGGISMNGLKSKVGKVSLLAYTVLDVTEQQNVIVNAGFTAATRIQLVLNGVPIRHKQVLELAPGKYPLLIVLRMGASWGQIEPNLGKVPEDQIALAKKLQDAADIYAAEAAKLKAAGAPKRVLFKKASEVTKEERSHMFWLPDQDMVDAWIKLHTPEAQ